MRNTLTYDPIYGYNVKKIIKDIEEYNPTRIIIFNELEWEQRQLPKYFYDLVKEKNIEFKMIHGNSDNYMLS